MVLGCVGWPKGLPLPRAELPKLQGLWEQREKNSFPWETQELKAGGKLEGHEYLL